MGEVRRTKNQQDGLVYYTIWFDVGNDDDVVLFVHESKRRGKGEHKVKWWHHEAKIAVVNHKTKITK